MSLYIVQADITTRQVDAIVCTANKDLTLGGIMGDKVKSVIETTTGTMKKTEGAS